MIIHLDLNLKLVIRSHQIQNNIYKESTNPFKGKYFHLLLFIIRI